MRSLVGNRLIYAPLILGVALIVSTFVVAETGHRRLREATDTLIESQNRQFLLSRYLRLLLQAESAQRGFLLTEDTRYLRGFDPALKGIAPLIADLSASYERSGIEEAESKINDLRAIGGAKTGEMLASLRLYGERDLAAALALLNTDVGQQAMSDLHVLITILQDAESTRLTAAAAAWADDLGTSRVLLILTSAFSLILIVTIGLLLARDMQRREKRNVALGEQNAELDRLVQNRTAMLFDLSSNMQRVTEREKAALARELHDELGSLLVATKIDVSWLRRSCDDGSEASKLRWDRVLRCMDDGLSLKRRVIESLRPTLLDNLGLVAALRWLVDETLRRAGIECEEDYSDNLPELSPDARIAVFRIVQESMINIVKHSKAQHVRLAVGVDERGFSVSIQDDGLGIDESRLDVASSHGLRGMRHRIESMGGLLHIRSPGLGEGTEISFTLPLDRIQLAV